jgi:hypothetical protein
VPLTLDAGTRLFEGVPPLKSEQVKSRAATSFTHLTSRVLSELADHPQVLIIAPPHMGK